jgi:hypothetical protein
MAGISRRYSTDSREQHWPRDTQKAINSIFVTCSIRLVCHKDAAIYDKMIVSVLQLASTIFMFFSETMTITGMLVRL